MWNDMAGKTNMIGCVRLLAAAAAISGTAIGAVQANPLSNGGFESPAAGIQYNGVQYDASPSAEYSYISQLNCCSSASPETMNGWTWAGNTGVIAGGVASSFNSNGVIGGYTGNQYAFLQNNYLFNYNDYSETLTTSSIAQSFTLASNALVSISWLASGRANNGTMSYTVTAGSLNASDSVNGGNPFSSGSLSGELAAGTYTLTFTNTTNSGDASVYLDDITVSVAVPEPAGLLALCTGLIALLFWRRGRENVLASSLPAFD